MGECCLQILLAIELEANLYKDVSFTITEMVLLLVEAPTVAITFENLIRDLLRPYSEQVLTYCK